MTLLIQLPKGSQSTAGVTDTTLATGEGTKISITPGLDTDGLYQFGPSQFWEQQKRFQHAQSRHAPVVLDAGTFAPSIAHLTSGGVLIFL